MALTSEQAVQLFKRVGIKPIVVKTGSPNWVRCFLEYKGCRYGRASFFNGELWNIKWYDKGEGFELRETDRLKTAIVLMRDYNMSLGNELWDLLVQRAKLKQDLAYRAKLANREALEEQDIARGRKKPKKRRAIQKPNIRNFLTVEDMK
ncbi:hypothetical protein pVco14_087 [Vibrio phage pVco-14]|nr:hypothetical protein pVco14_087 [Vibrio phage pVco-14]